MLIDAEFADRIINKYTAFGTYQLDDANLVFLKQERQIQPVFAPARKLLFQLYMNWQNYSRSGQKLSVNWSMLERTIAGNLREEIRVQSGKSVKAEAERILKTSLQTETELYIQNRFQKETVRYLQNNINTETKRYLQNAIQAEEKQFLQNRIQIETELFIKHEFKEKAEHILKKSLQQEIKQALSVSLDQTQKQALYGALQEEMVQMLYRGLQKEITNSTEMRWSEITQQIVQDTFQKNKEYTLCRNLPEIMTVVIQHSMKDVDEFVQTQYLENETLKRIYEWNQKNRIHRLHIRVGKEESQLILNKQPLNGGVLGIEPRTVKISLGKRVNQEMKENLRTVALEKILSGNDEVKTEVILGRFREELVSRLYVSLERTAGQELRQSIRDEAIHQIQSDLISVAGKIPIYEVEQLSKEIAVPKNQEVRKTDHKKAADIQKQRQRQQEKKREFAKKSWESRSRQTFGKTSSDIAERISRTLQHRIYKDSPWTREGRAKKEQGGYQSKKRQQELHVNHQGSVKKDILHSQSRTSEEQKQRLQKRLLEDQIQITRNKKMEIEQSLYHRVTDEKYKDPGYLQENSSILPKNHATASIRLDAAHIFEINNSLIDHFKLETLQEIILSEKFNNYDFFENRGVFGNIQSIESLQSNISILGLENVQSMKDFFKMNWLQRSKKLEWVQSMTGIPGIKYDSFIRSLEGRDGIQRIYSLRGIKSLEGREGIQRIQRIHLLRGIKGFRGIAQIKNVRELRGIESLKIYQIPQGMINLESMMESQYIKSIEAVIKTQDIKKLRTVNLYGRESFNRIIKLRNMKRLQGLNSLHNTRKLQEIKEIQKSDGLQSRQDIKNIQNIQSIKNFQIIHSKNQSLLKSVTGLEKSILEEIISKEGKSVNKADLQFAYQIENLNHCQVRILNSISLLKILNLSNVWRDKKQLQGENASAVLHKKSQQSEMFGYITTIFKERGQNPGEVKKAEKKLIEILIKDISAQTMKLREQEEKANRIFIARQAVLELLKETESRTLIRTAILDTDHSQQQLIQYVRLIMGNQAAEQLKKYFFTRNIITGQAMNEQMGRLRQDYEKDAAESFLATLQKEQTLKSIRPGGYIQMENMIREKVHIPSVQNLQERKIRLEHMVRMLGKDYGLAVQRNLLAANIRKEVQYQAEEKLLLPAVLPQFKAGRTMPVIIKDLRLKTQYSNDFKPENSSEEKETSSYRHTGTIIYRDSENDKLKKQKEEHVNSLNSTMHYEEQKQILKKQSSQEDELRQTKQLLGTLNERVELQDVVLKELKKISVAGEKLPAENVNQIAKEVLKKMEQDLRLERLRRGL